MLGYYRHTDRTVIVSESSQVLLELGWNQSLWPGLLACLPHLENYIMEQWGNRWIKGLWCLERVDFISQGSALYTVCQWIAADKMISVGKQDTGWPRWKRAPSAKSLSSFAATYCQEKKYLGSLFNPLRLHNNNLLPRYSLAFHPTPIRTMSRFFLYSSGVVTMKGIIVPYNGSYYFTCCFFPLSWSFVLKQHNPHFAHSVNVNSITEHRCILLF